ncbi:MAG: hypothetical protein GX606_06615 [Elusimicrobia bacterium]|nr:hypothetical protein [Elusimicrobiota bacterium]
MDGKPDIGQILKEERERRALTLDVVHEATKIPLDSLRAIEEGYRVRTLTPFYYKNFVKAYARYLDIDVGGFLAEEKPPSATVLPRTDPSSASSSAPRLNAMSLKIFARPSRAVARKVLKIAVVFLLVVGGCLVLFGIVRGIRALGTRIFRPGSHEVRAPEKSPDPVVKEKAAPAAPKVQTAPAAPAAISQTASATFSKVQVTVRSSGSASLVVTADGKVVMQDTLRRGDVESWGAQRSIEIVGRGIPLLEFEINGKGVGRLGSRGRSIRKVVVTPEGVTTED